MRNSWKFAGNGNSTNFVKFQEILGISTPLQKFVQICTMEILGNSERFPHEIPRISISREFPRNSREFPRNSRSSACSSKHDGGGTKAPPPGHFAFEICELSAVACWQHYQGRNKLFVYMQVDVSETSCCGSRDESPSVMFVKNQSQQHKQSHSDAIL